MEIERRIQKAEEDAIKTMYRIGEMCVTEARLNGSYTDRTGNLRSSIGYIILKNGQVISENFRESDKGTDKKTGLKEGRDFASKIAKKFNKGIVLIVVAGMIYSQYLEAMGKNVITSAELLAKKEAPKLIARVFRKRT